MPWMLYRLILMDLIRIVGLTATVLVTVIAFGATIKPLSNDALLDASQTVKYLVLVIVPMLQFALPFAAGFGATQALHRMTTDNEIQAMAASGISYRRILMPVIGMGVVLSLAMVVLTQTVIPKFWVMLVQTATMDMPKMFQAKIRNGEAFQNEKLQIYAEYLITKEWPDGPDGPKTRMFLFKVAAATLDEHGRIATDITANQAVADVYSWPGRTLIKLVMRDAVAFKPDSGQLGGSVEARRTIVFVDPLKDKCNAKTRSELLALRKNPDLYGDVINARELLAQAICDAQARAAIDEQLRSFGRLELIGEAIGDAGEHRTYIINAKGSKDDQLVTRDGRRVEITQFDGKSEMRRFVAESARLAPATMSDSLSGIPTFDLVLGTVEVSDLRPGGAAGAANMRASVTIPSLVVSGAEQGDKDLLNLPSEALVARTVGMHDGPEHLFLRVEKVKHQIDSLQREITSRLLYRYALSATAFLLLMLGATLALWLRGSLPLTIYAWAFLPSVLDLILISTGEQLLRDGKMIGYFIMWSGNAMMLLAILFAYSRVSRH